MMTYNEIIKNINILLADDDEDYLLMTYAFLKQAGYNVDKVTDGPQALDALNKKDYQILLIDYFMPGMNGEEVIKSIREKNKQLIIILQTGFAGKKPPVEMMQELDIQNYYDKTEGIARLNLELISAVRIFNQQNEIELSKYKTNAIGSLIAGIAQEIKSNLLSVSAGLEVTNMFINDQENTMNKENAEKLNKFYTNNKETLVKIDRILTSLIMQSESTTESVMEAQEVIDIISLILKGESKATGVKLSTNVSLRANSYIKGGINEIIFIVSEVIKRIMEVSIMQDVVELTLTEDDQNWFFKVASNNINKLTTSFTYILKRLIVSITGANIVFEDNSIILSLAK